MLSRATRVRAWPFEASAWAWRGPYCRFRAAAGPGRGGGNPRADSEWDVSEPELSVVGARPGCLVGYLNGSDMPVLQHRG